MTKPRSPSRYFALIPAAGAGSRMQAALPKQYLPLCGVPMLRRTAAVFPACAQIAATYVVVSAGDGWATGALDGLDATILRCGGASRAESVLNGLRALRTELADHDWVLVHDAARPGLTPQLVEALIAGVAEDAVGGLLALPVVDTVKRAGAAGDAADPARAQHSVERAGLWLAQTPQMFRYGILLDALEQAASAQAITAGAITDEASAIEALGLQPMLVEGHARNLKVTLPRDMETVAQYFNEDEQTMTENQGAGVLPFRIGQGYDCHALVEGRALVIGGVTIAHSKGLLGHSDADVLLHALTDALLGAAALGDIGRHFPDTDARFAGADSRVLLREAVARVAAAGYAVGNVDATIIAQAPKMAPHIPAMVAHIAADLGIAPGQVNVKAKTNEKLGYLGREEGMAAEAVALLVRLPR